MNKPVFVDGMELPQKPKDINEAFHLVLKYFNNDLEKFLLWLHCRNPRLTNTPYGLYMSGKAENLAKFIYSEINGLTP